MNTTKKLVVASFLVSRFILAACIKRETKKDATPNDSVFKLDSLIAHSAQFLGSYGLFFQWQNKS